MKSVLKGLLIISTLTVTNGFAQEARLLDGLKARDILKSAYEYINSHNSFEINAITTSEDILNQDTVMQESRNIKVVLKRPNELYIQNDADYQHRRYYLKDGKFIIYDADINLYGEIRSDKDIDGTLDKIFEEYGIASPLANLLYTNLKDRVMPKARSYYMGLRKVDGKWCHYLIFSNQVKELEVWIDAKGEPIIRKFTVIDKSTPLRLHSTSKLKWKFDKVNEKIFTFTPPFESAKIVVKPAPKGVYK